MDLDKNKIVTQDQTGELAPIDQVEERVEAEMKRLKGEAKKLVAEGRLDGDLRRTQAWNRDEAKPAAVASALVGS